MKINFNRKMYLVVEENNAKDLIVRVIVIKAYNKLKYLDSILSQYGDSRG